MEYTFEVIAREDKGSLGADLNKASQIHFKTCCIQRQNIPLKNNQDSSNPDTFLSIEIITIIAVASVMLILLIIGTVYKTVIITRIQMNNSTTDNKSVKRQNSNPTPKALRKQISMDNI